MNIRNILLGVLAAMAFPVIATPQGWLDDFEAAKAKAAAEGKKILIDFSGSDWCGWCIKLDKEVLSKGEFISQASKSFVLLLVDSPRDKGRLSPKARQENPKLVSEFGVRGYPTLVVTDASGREIFRQTGFVSGGPPALLKLLNTKAKAGAGAGAGTKTQPIKAKSTSRLRNCGKDCCKVRICNCCRKNNGKCCPDNGAPPGSFTNSAEKVVESQPAKERVPPKTVEDDAGETMVRYVNGYELRTEDPNLVKELAKLATFFEKVSTAFDRETGGYYAGQRHHYAGILLHADKARRGEKSKFFGSKNFYSMYLPDNMQDKTWCYFLCDSFLSRTKGAGQKEIQMCDQMLVYVGYRVAAALGLDGAAATLSRVGEDKKGVRRLLHELSAMKADAIPEYYKAKIGLAETERIGIVVPTHDVAEIFSGVVGKDVFNLFSKFGVHAQRDKVSTRLVGFSTEFAAQNGQTNSLPATVDKENP